MSRTLGTVAVCAFAAFGFAATALAEAYTANLQSAQEAPANASTATGYARVTLDEPALTISWTVVFSGLSSAQTASHIHGPAAIGANAAVAINFGAVGGTSGTISGTSAITAPQIAQLRAHQMYVNVHSTTFPGGEIRGQLAPRRAVDYDGDGAVDLSILRFPVGTTPSPITYYNLNTTSGIQIAPWGDANTDFPVPGDYDGDGMDDLAIYRAGATAGAQSFFWIRYSSDGSVHPLPWGLNGDQPVCRDYDGDGKTDIAVFRPGASPGAPAFWYILQSSTGTARIVHWGTTGNGTTSVDTPVPEDYDGDGKADLAVYRWGLTPNNSYLIQRSSDGGYQVQPWGNFSTDYIAPGDFDGDGKTDFVAVRTGASASSPLTWWIRQSSTGTNRVMTFGITSDLITQGDYDGDGRTDIAIYRKGATPTSNSLFWILKSLTNSVSVRSWGLQGDFPVASYNAR